MSAEDTEAQLCKAISDLYDYFDAEQVSCLVHWVDSHYQDSKEYWHDRGRLFQDAKLRMQMLFAGLVKFDKQ